MATEAPPTTEERYLAATNTSDLTVAGGKEGLVTGGDIIAAAGFGKSWLGSALLHFRAEWDRCDKPRRKTPAEIAKRAQELPKRNGKPDTRRAEIEALVDHARAMRARAEKLTGRSVVVGLMADWAQPRGIDVDLIGPALFHWLAPACGACEGRGHTKIPDTPALSRKVCNHCNGSGLWPRPHGVELLHAHIRSCIGQAKKGTAAAFFGE
jgi:hypothetical protein